MCGSRVAAAGLPLAAAVGHSLTIIHTGDILKVYLVIIMSTVSG